MLFMTMQKKQISARAIGKKNEGNHTFFRDNQTKAIIKSAKIQNIFTKIDA